MPQKVKRCGGCGGTGHTPPECQKRDFWTCKKCNGIGHGFWECTQPKDHGVKCYLCSEMGHQSNMCTNTSKWRCKICDRLGHQPVGCPIARSFKWPICHGCGKKGHFVSQCAEAMCYICGLIGHIAPNCPRKKKFSPQPICTNCGSYGHDAWTCTERDGGSAFPPFNPSYGQQQKQNTGWWSQPPSSGYDTTSTPAAGHEKQCSCKLCSASNSAPTTDQSEAKKSTEQSHVHEDDCTCSICSLKSGRRGKQYSFGSFSSEHCDPPHGSACACSLCSRTRAHAKPQAQSESSQNDSAVDLWNGGQALLASGQTDIAIRLFNQAIAKDPYAAKFYASRGDAFAMKRDHTAALGDFQRALSLLSVAESAAEVASVLVNVAQCRLSLGSHDAAILAVSEALKADDSNEAALALKWRVAQIRKDEEAYRLAKTGGRWRVARTAWEACVHRYNEEQCVVPMEVRCWEVELAMVEQSWASARDLVGKLAAEQSQDMGVILTSTTVQFLYGDLQAALEQARSGLRLDPDNRGLKSMYTRVKAVSRFSTQAEGDIESLNYGAALQNWKLALDSVPDSPEYGEGGLLRSKLLVNRAEAEFELQRLAEGLKSVDAALKLNPTSWQAHLIRGRLDLSSELYDTAVGDFTTSLEHAISDTSDADGKDIVRIRLLLQDAETSAAEAKDAEKDYYKILGLTPDCTQTEIRGAYLRESLKHHPDKGGSEERFKLVNEAYSVLSDSDARRAHDAEHYWQGSPESSDDYGWD